MITVPELAADALGEFLSAYMHRRFGSSSRLVEIVPSIARIAIECIGNSDALYHNVETTMLVTLAGHDIMRGRALHMHMPPEDYAHVIIACLMHDIGYVRGLFKADDEKGYVVSAPAPRRRGGAAVPTPRCWPGTSTAPRCSCSSASRASSCSIPSASPAPSKARAFPPACRSPARRSTRSRRSCAPPT